MSHDQGGHRGNNHIHVGSVLVGAAIAVLHQAHREHVKHTRHRRHHRVSPITRYQLNAKQAIKAISFGRICGLVVMGLFLIEYARALGQL